MYGYAQEDLIDRMRDNRSERKMRSDLHKNIDIREKQVMHALATEYIARGVKDYPTYEKVDQSELGGNITFDNRPKTRPDYYFYVNNKTFTYEIKFNNYEHFYKDDDGVETIYIKCGAIISMLKHPTLYPNGHAIIATRRQFLILTAQQVANFTIGTPKQYSTNIYSKKAYFIPAETVQDLWKPWMSAIEDRER